ncbi:MAG: SDR family oxidoreductase [Nocardioides sp.]|nr:SDR family oxidoreductase [Nocardioides sp.]
MLVFVTGASGGIGSAVTAELLAAGHEVLGLARSDASAAAITNAGVTPLRGDLTDLASLRAGAEQADGVINLAFSNDFSDFAAGVEQEARAVETFGAALAGTGKPFVFAAGTPAYPGRVSTEGDPANTEGAAGGRGRNADAVLALAEQGVRSSVVRLPRSVHLRGSAYGFASMLIGAAQQSGTSAYVGDGSQRWPAVNRLDAATLFRLALEEAEPGSVLHAVADEGDPMRSLAEAIGSALSIPVTSVPAEQFGFLGSIFAVDQPSSSALTRERYGWKPTHPSLLDDLAAGDYPDHRRRL